MTMHDFIFTKKRPQKYLRHLVFWVGFAFFWMFWAGPFFIDLKRWLSFVWEVQLQYTILIEMGYTYVTVYYLLPRYYSRKKYVKVSLLFSLFTFLFYILYLFNRLRIEGLTNVSEDELLLLIWFISMNFIINGPPVALGMFFTLKMLKTWYLEMEEHKALIKENVQAELQLLKAQVHPHFLFNTLNNIYSFALVRSPDAGGLVLKLSNTLQYMINDCEADLVPLEKEIQLIRNYIGLEKVRYGNRLRLHVEIAEGFGSNMIAPLLMLPFVENSFKHGVSKMRGRQWINLQLSMQNDLLFFTISNSRSLQPVSQHEKAGIGLLNVQKRLQLLYPGKHHLIIESTNDSYTVKMQIKLEGQYVPLGTGIPITQAQSVSYG